LNYFAVVTRKCGCNRQDGVGEVVLPEMRCDRTAKTKTEKKEEENKKSTNG